MSFRILTDDEKQFLDEEQLRIYNEEYELYLERNRFVDRLETLGKIKKPEVRAKVKNIKPVVTIRERKYENPHFDRIDIRSRINIKDHSVLPHKFVLPELRVPGIDTRIEEAPELRKSIRSEVSLSGMPDTGVQLPRTTAFISPELSVSGINTTVPETAAFSYKEPEHTLLGTENIPRSFKVPSHNFKAPEKTKPVLDTYIPKAHNRIEFELPEHCITGFVQPEIKSAAKHFSLPEFKAELPDVNIGSGVNITPFEAENVRVMNMPEINIDQVSAAKYTAVKAEAVSVPDISVSEAKRLKASYTVQPEINMPEFSVNEYHGRKFEMPETGRVSLDTRVASAPEKTFHKENLNDLHTELPDINVPEFSVNEYHGRKFDMPETGRVSLDTRVGSAPEKTYRTENLNDLHTELPEINMPEFSVNEYHGRKFDMPEIGRVSLNTRVASAPGKTFHKENLNDLHTELPDINVPEFRSEKTSGRDFEVNKIRKISLDTEIKTFSDRKIEIPEFSVAIEKNSVSSPEEIKRGIEMYSKIFNDSLALMKQGTSGTDHKKSKQKETGIQ